jgi:hypothetical protein
MQVNSILPKRNKDASNRYCSRSYNPNYEPAATSDSDMSPKLIQALVRGPASICPPSQLAPNYPFLFEEIFLELAT